MSNSSSREELSLWHRPPPARPPRQQPWQDEYEVQWAWTKFAVVGILLAHTGYLSAMACVAMVGWAVDLLGSNLRPIAYALAAMSYAGSLFPGIALWWGLRPYTRSAPIYGYLVAAIGSVTLPMALGPVVPLE